jgi:gliding motility-associated-like protein
MWVWTPITYLDSNTVQHPWARPLKSMVYTLTGLNQYSCKATADVKINVIHKSNTGVPNVFSPNGDGLNDIFKIEHLKFEKLLEFKIFNRYGQLVFESQDPQQGWDGSYKGKTADAGVYYYRIVVALPPDGMAKVFKGDVTLIR